LPKLSSHVVVLPQSLINLPVAAIVCVSTNPHTVQVLCLLPAVVAVAAVSTIHSPGVCAAHFTQTVLVPSV